MSQRQKRPGLVVKETGSGKSDRSLASPTQPALEHPHGPEQIVMSRSTRAMCGERRELAPVEMRGDGASAASTSSRNLSADRAGDPFADRHGEAALRQPPERARQPPPRQRAQQRLALAPDLLSSTPESGTPARPPAGRAAGDRTSRLCAMLMRSTFTSGSFGR